MLMIEGVSAGLNDGPFKFDWLTPAAAKTKAMIAFRAFITEKIPDEQQENASSQIFIHLVGGRSRKAPVMNSIEETHFIDVNINSVSSKRQDKIGDSLLFQIMSDDQTFAFDKSISLSVKDKRNQMKKFLQHKGIDVCILIPIAKSFTTPLLSES